MSESWSEERISEYLDGQLTADEREQVESHLSQHPADAEMLSEFRQLQAAMRSAPKYALDSDFTSRVMATIRSQIRPSRPVAVPITQGVDSSLSQATSWRAAAATITALAAMLLLAFIIAPATKPTTTAMDDRSKDAVPTQAADGDDKLAEVDSENIEKTDEEFARAQPVINMKEFNSRGDALDDKLAGAADAEAASLPSRSFQRVESGQKLGAGGGFGGGATEGQEVDKIADRKAGDPVPGEPPNDTPALSGGRTAIENMPGAAGQTDILNQTDRVVSDEISEAELLDMQTELLLAQANQPIMLIEVSEDDLKQDAWQQLLSAPDLQFADGSPFQKKIGSMFRLESSSIDPTRQLSSAEDATQQGIANETNPGTASGVTDSLEVKWSYSGDLRFVHVEGSEVEIQKMLMQLGGRQFQIMDPQLLTEKNQREQEMSRDDAAGERLGRESTDAADFDERLASDDGATGDKSTGRVARTRMFLPVPKPQQIAQAQSRRLDELAKSGTRGAQLQHLEALQQQNQPDQIEGEDTAERESKRDLSPPEKRRNVARNRSAKSDQKQSKISPEPTEKSIGDSEPTKKNTEANSLASGIPQTSKDPSFFSKSETAPPKIVSGIEERGQYLLVIKVLPTQSPKQAAAGGESVPSSEAAQKGEKAKSAPPDKK